MLIVTKIIGLLAGVIAVWCILLAYRADYGLLPMGRKWGPYLRRAMIFPVGVGCGLVSPLILFFAVHPIGALEVWALVGGGLAAAVAFFVLLICAYFGTTSFRVMDLHEAFATEHGLKFELLGRPFDTSAGQGMMAEKRSRGWVQWPNGQYMALIATYSGGSAENRGISVLHRLEFTLDGNCGNIQYWIPIEGFRHNSPLIQKAITQLPSEVAAVKGRVGRIALFKDRLRLTANPARSAEELNAYLKLGEALKTSLSKGGITCEEAREPGDSV